MQVLNLNLKWRIENKRQFKEYSITLSISILDVYTLIHLHTWCRWELESTLYNGHIFADLMIIVAMNNILMFFPMGNYLAFMLVKFKLCVTTAAKDGAYFNLKDHLVSYFTLRFIFLPLFTFF